VPYPSFLDDYIDLLCAGKGPADMVFASPNGHVLRASNFRRNTFDTAVASLRETYPELPMITPHSLRHTAASLAILSGASVLSIQRMLGHSSAAMTLDVYSDLFDDDLDAVADALDQRARNTNVGKMWANPRSRTQTSLESAPTSSRSQCLYGAACQNRTDDLLITSEMLYQLS
jgi:hypothetical protein